MKLVSSLTSILNSRISCDIQVFTSSGTWTKPANTKAIQVIAFGAGGGGGSGAVSVTANTASGGGGGGGGAYAAITLHTNAVPDTVAVTVGSPGNGAVGATYVSAALNGNNGTNGGNSSFGSYVVANGGALGGGGVANDTANTQSNGSGGIFINPFSGGVGSKSLSSPASSVSQSAAFAAGGGGAGGSRTSGPGYLPTRGGAGSYIRLGTTADGGDAANGVSGSTGTSRPSTGLAGDGGGGGSVSIVPSTVYSGGGGGIPGGGGGGGGGLQYNSGTSGAGGAGGRGEVIIISYL